ncbi:hypothetical protein [Flavobacterium sp.]|uniref:hypothetical protein n=1 Tax=Flavobacterium sp. TaxID=239 RepID=UPI0025C1DA36|nr:hypothetical protein [Flavobacterium sp.]
MENIIELSEDEVKDINGGIIIGILSLGLAAAWCCYELGAACAAYDARHNL